MIKVEESLLSNEGISNINFHFNDPLYAEYKIYENDKPIFEVFYDEKYPYDNTLSKNFKDCYNIICLLEKFYNYGLEGKKVSFGMRDI